MFTIDQTYGDTLRPGNDRDHGGLDRRLLAQVRDYHGEWAVKLLLTI